MMVLASAGGAMNPPLRLRGRVGVVMLNGSPRALRRGDRSAQGGGVEWPRTARPALVPPRRQT